MTDPAADIAAAERRAAQARERLSGSLQLLQARLKPRTLARDAAQSAAAAGQNAARAGVDVARHHPGPVAGAVAAAGLFLARHRIAALFRRRQPAGAKAKSRSVRKD